MTKIVDPNLNQHSWEEKDWVKDIAVSDDIQQTLARLVGYDPNAKTFRFIPVDSDGRLLVGSGGIRTNAAVISAVDVLITATLLINENLDRNALNIYNNGTDVVYLGFTSSVVIADGFPVEAGANFYTENYTGKIYAISPAITSNVRLMEIG